MEKTENFELSQWEKTDRILMEDFNNNNQKIEDAILSRMGPIEVISEQILTEPASYLLIDMEGFDWSQWSIVIPTVWTTVAGDTSYKTLISLDGLSLKGGAFGDPGERTPGSMMMLMFPFRDGSQQVRVMGFPGGDLCYADLTYRGSVYTDIEAIRFSIANPLQYPVGTALMLYGIR